MRIQPYGFQTMMRANILSYLRIKFIKQSTSIDKSLRVGMPVLMLIVFFLLMRVLVDFRKEQEENELFRIQMQHKAHIKNTLDSVRREQLLQDVEVVKEDINTLPKDIIDILEGRGLMNDDSLVTYMINSVYQTLSTYYKMEELVIAEEQT